MNILTSLDRTSDYSKRQLEVILGAWVLSGLVDRKAAISTQNGDVSEDDYDKRSIYSLFYALYRSMGDVPSDKGTRYELTFNTWGYTWPESWGPCPNDPNDPQLYGRNAYTGLYQFPEVKEYVAARDGRVHIVELGCGTGAGAHHVCKNVLPKATYEAVDMQAALVLVGTGTGLDLLDLADPCGNETHGLVHRHHRSAKGKAIVRQLRHLFRALGGCFRKQILDGDRRALDQRSDPFDIIEMNNRQPGFGPGIRHDPDNAGIVGKKPRLAVGRTMHLDLAVRLALEPFDQNEIDRRHPGEQLLQPRLFRTAQFMHQRPAPARGHQHLGSARLAVHPGILAGHVDVEFVVGMLDHGDAQSFAEQARNRALQQGGLAGAAPSREANYLHSRLPEHRPEPALKSLVPLLYIGVEGKSC